MQLKRKTIEHFNRAVGNANGWLRFPLILAICVEKKTLVFFLCVCIIFSFWKKKQCKPFLVFFLLFLLFIYLSLLFYHQIVRQITWFGLFTQKSCYRIFFSEANILNSLSKLNFRFLCLKTLLGNKWLILASRIEWGFTMSTFKSSLSIIFSRNLQSLIEFKIHFCQNCWILQCLPKLCSKGLLCIHLLLGINV